jgi:hypothetical protein
MDRRPGTVSRARSSFDSGRPPLGRFRLPSNFIITPRHVWTGSSRADEERDEGQHDGHCVSRMSQSILAMIRRASAPDTTPRRSHSSKARRPQSASSSRAAFLAAPRLTTLPCFLAATAACFDISCLPRARRFLRFIAAPYPTQHAPRKRTRVSLHSNCAGLVAMLRRRPRNASSGGGTGVCRFRSPRWGESLADRVPKKAGPTRVRGDIKNLEAVLEELEKAGVEITRRGSPAKETRYPRSSLTAGRFSRNRGEVAAIPVARHHGPESAAAKPSQSEANMA